MKENLKEGKQRLGGGGERAEVADKVAGAMRQPVASGLGATLGHFCQNVDEVVQP